MNTFDAVVCVAVILAIALGFRAGLLRSLATILGYVIAAPVAVALAPRMARLAFGSAPVSAGKTWLTLCVLFLALGIVASALLRSAVSTFSGSDIGLFDRLAGAALGAVRIGLVAVLIVVIFDRIIPADREPPFLAGSRLRPYLSAAGKKGLQSLPPDIEAYIDRLKRERHLT